MLAFPRWKMVMVLSVCAFFILAALPNVLPQKMREGLPSWMPVNTVPLGLDLRGGSHLLLQLDFDAYLKDQMLNLRDQLRARLRKERIGYLNLRAHKDDVTLTIRMDTVREEVDVARILQEESPDITIDIDESGNTRLHYEDKALTALRVKLLAQSIEIVERRVNESGTKEPIVQRQGNNRIVVQVPGLSDPAQLKALIGKTAKMDFHLVNEDVTPEQIARGTIPTGTRLYAHDGDDQGAGMEARLAKTPIYTSVALSGELLTNAQTTFQDGMPVVDFTFNSLGARKFGEITQENIGKRFAIVLDNKIITAPVIRSAIIGGRGIIEGNFTVESANQLAVLLRAGALPAPLDVIEERSVGPSLGQDSIDKGTISVAMSMLLIIVFMTLSYGLFGVFANLALIINGIIIMACLSMLQATLTLPGIAGIALTMAMAVDANVLIFERIRDELRNGKSPIAAIDSGFKIAFGTVFDSNVTTLMAASLLFYFGAGTVKGFAVTLSIGIISSMFTAIMLTRLFIVWWARATKPKTVPI
jgi:preprotein translocase subunit SecD